MEEDKTSPRAFTDCVCPRCGMEHRMRLYWTGKLPARKYCWICEKVVDDLSRGVNSISLIISGRDVEFHISKKDV